MWLGVGGTPESFVRTGTLGVPLMVAVIGGEMHRFRPLIDLYREAGAAAGFTPGQLKVGLHSPGYVGSTDEQAAEKLMRHSEALVGIDRFTFQMDNAGLTHAQLMKSIGLIGTKVIPLLHAQK